MPYPPVPFPTGQFFTSKTHTDTYPEIDPLTKSDCSGKAVLITGASKGVGRATAISYALAGASHIALLARSDLSSVEAEIIERCKAAGRVAPKLLCLATNVADLASVEAAAAAVTKEFERLDILYNNAGVLHKFKTVTESDPDEWTYSWEVNMRGAYLVTRALIPLMLDKGGDKTVINTTSIGAHTIISGVTSYVLSKTSMIHFSECLMVEYGDRGLLSYSVHPGAVLTELGLNMPEEMHAWLQDKPEVPGDALAFLTQKRREWLAGRYLSLTWDMPELLAREKEIVEGDKLKIRLVL